MTMTAELHDGRILEFPDGTEPTVIQATVKRMLGVRPATSADRIGSAVNTISEPIVSMASGAVGSALGGLAGGVAAAIPGLRPGIGADVSRTVSNAMTYEPRSAGGKAVMGAVSAPFEWLAGKADQAGQAASEATGSPLAGAAVNTGIQALPMLAGPLARKAGLGAPEATATVDARNATRSVNSIKDNTLATARAEGYVIPPSAIEGSFLGNRVEGVAGKAAIRQEAQLKNQPITNKIARREAGLAEDAPISEGTLEKARDVLAAPYRELAALPGLPAPRVTTQLNPMRPAYSMFGKTPDTPAQLVHDWKSTNTQATELWRDYQRNGKVETLDAYRAKLKDKDAIEANMEKAAIAAGRPDLVPALKEARVRLAKNYNVERALNVGSGDVDAAVLGRMLDRGLPLTDGLETVGRFANAFSPYVRDAAKVPTPGVSKVEALSAAMLGAGGHASGLGWLPAGLPFLAGPARSLMLSKMMQTPRAYEQGALSRLMSSDEFANTAGAAPFAGQSLADLQRRQEQR